jgi:hypothetical protein
LSCQPEKGADGVANVNKVSVGSGEKLLRTVMNEEKLELYNLYVSQTASRVIKGFPIILLVFSYC